jgi:hypothetical protein
MITACAWRRVPPHPRHRLHQPRVCLALISLILAGCGGSAEGSGRSPRTAAGPAQVQAAEPLKVIKALTPPFRVRGYRTSGAYPQVRGAVVDLTAVNAALRGAVAADQRDYLAYARRARTQVEGPNGPSYLRAGVYRTTLDRRLVSASTVVVSALIPRTRNVIRGEGGGDGWISTTVHVPSAEGVSIRDLFADPAHGLRVFGSAWRKALGRQGMHCADTYPELYAPSSRNYRNFALTPTGLAVGVNETGACGAWHATVPYVLLRPHLSAVGKDLVAGVRKPR